MTTNGFIDLHFTIRTTVLAISILIFTVKLLRSNIKILHYTIIPLFFGLYSYYMGSINILAIFIVISLYLRIINNIKFTQLITPLTVSITNIILVEDIFARVTLGTNEYVYLISAAGIVVFALIMPKLYLKVIDFDKIVPNINRIALSAFLIQIVTIYILSLRTDFIFFISSINIYLLGLVSLYIYSSLCRVKFETEGILNEVAYVKDLNLKIRAQKHDFDNHLQVLTGLIQTKKYEACLNYAINLNKHPISRDTTNTGVLAISALVSSKKDMAQEKGIEFDIDINDKVTGVFYMQSWELVSILSNIIDNAVFEELKSKKERKHIRFCIKKVDKYFEFSINNLGSYIDEKTRIKIFEPGFSTKGNAGQGIGLYITKNTVERHEGTVTVESSLEDGTTFVIRVPEVKNNDK